jgi:hypothetical protein
LELAESQEGAAVEELVITIVQALEHRVLLEGLAVVLVVRMEEVVEVVLVVLVGTVRGL